MKKSRTKGLRKLMLRKYPKVRRQKPTFEIRRIPVTRPECLDFEQFIDGFIEKG